MRAQIYKGAGTSASRIGQPDLALLTLTEMYQNAAMIAGLDPSTPLIADADTGFGGPVNCDRMLRLYDQAGIAGFHIEDQIQNKRCGHLKGKQLVPLDTFISRITACVNTRSSIPGCDIVIIARTDAEQVYGMDDAIARLKAAVKAGADVAFLEGFQTLEDGERTVRELAPTPVLVNCLAGGKTPTITTRKAREMGFKIAIYPVAGVVPAALAMRQAYRALKDPEIGTDEGQMNGTNPHDLFRMVGLDEAIRRDTEAGGSMYSTV